MKKALLVLLFLFLFTSSTLAADSGSSNASFKITGDDLSFSGLPENVTFDEVNWKDLLTYVDTEYIDEIQISDSRGTGEGWSLTLSVDQFERNGIPITDSQEKISLSFENNAEIESVDGYSKEGIEINQGITENLVGKDDTVVVNATEGSGMGTYNLEAELKLEANSLDLLIGSYETTMTWTLNETPR